jgi:hypothetical protein
MNNEIETVIESLPAKKRPGPNRFTTKSTNAAETIPKIMLPDSLYKDNITLRPKPGKDATKNKVVGHFP